MKRDRWSELNDEAEPKAIKFAATNYQLERERQIAKAGYMRGYRAGATRNERRGFAAHASAQETRIDEARAVCSKCGLSGSGGLGSGGSIVTIRCNEPGCPGGTSQNRRV
jgi:hypothetical protein